jgi:hypothetical protein
LVIAGFLADSVCGQPGQPTQVEPRFLLDRGRAGEIELGMSVDRVAQILGSDYLRLRAEFREGSFTPMLDITLPRSESDPAISAVISAAGSCPFHIFSMIVHDRRFKTAQGIGVGSTLADVRRAFPAEAIEVRPGGEEGGPPYVVVRTLGLSFALRGRGVFVIDDSLPVESVGVISQPPVGGAPRCGPSGR